MTCAITVELDDMEFDCDTADSNGIIWTADVEGWWAPADVGASLHDVAVGAVISAAHEKPKALVLRGMAATPAPHPPLANLWQIATRTLNQAIRIVHIPGLLVVNEETISLQSYVRRVGNPRYRMHGERHLLEFEVPLLAEDPYKYDATVTTDTSLSIAGAGANDSGTVANGGDAPTYPLITIDGPATNPKVINNTDDGKYVRWVGTLGAADTLIIDMAAGRMTVNGSFVASDPASRFWALLPGNNSLTYDRAAGASASTAQLDYRDAYT